ncbi:MAG: hypothetical protein DMG06_01540 [Acidobacteria bacterium]|nr:MAG: hypothetical protein DMG06_01540 [Acidobacteriota bacterium]
MNVAFALFSEPAPTVACASDSQLEYSCGPDSQRPAAKSREEDEGLIQIKHPTKVRNLQNPRCVSPLAPIGGEGKAVRGIAAIVHNLGDKPSGGKGPLGFALRSILHSLPRKVRT